MMIEIKRLWRGRRRAYHHHPCGRHQHAYRLSCRPHLHRQTQNRHRNMSPNSE